MVNFNIKVWFPLLIVISFNFVTTQDNSIERICQSCGDAVNEYCCRYYRSCCEYVNPNGCPAPSSPETKMSCRGLRVNCRSNHDCPMYRQCCDTFLCGAICMNTKPDTFPGYQY